MRLRHLVDEFGEGSVSRLLADVGVDRLVRLVADVGTDNIDKLWRVFKNHPALMNQVVDAFSGDPTRFRKLCDLFDDIPRTFRDDFAELRPGTPADVVAETAAGRRNLTSRFVLTADEALDAGETFVGPGGVWQGPNRFTRDMGDGTQRVFRLDPGSLAGNHPPKVPHYHLEVQPTDGGRSIINNHLIFVE